jgi:5,10-methylenetetrahydrofolate reductase
MTPSESGVPAPAVRASFRDLVRRAEAGRLWMYEAVPPRQDMPPEKRLKRVKRIREALGSLTERLCAFFVPDIDPQETGFGERKSADATWLDARDYAEAIRKKLKGVEAVVCRSSVRFAEDEQRAWLRASWEKRFRSVVAIGGDSRRRRFAGPSPERFARIVGELREAEGLDFAVGGICLPQRGMMNRYGDPAFRPDPELEPARMAEKSAQGVEFFMMQILYDAADALRVLDRYGRSCRERGMRPARVFIGVAPITCPQDVDFLGYLGVHLPPQALAAIGSDAAKMGERSIGYTVDMMRAVTAGLDAGLGVPVDVCIECTSPRNLGASVDLLGRLMGALG